MNKEEKQKKQETACPVVPTTCFFERCKLYNEKTQKCTFPLFIEAIQKVSKIVAKLEGKR